MKSILPAFKKSDYILTTLILALLIFVVLFVFRSLDDNRLTSWQWVFEWVDASKIFLILLAGAVLAYVFSRFSLPEAKMLFVLSFALAAFFWREPEVIVDASRYFTQAKHLELYGIGYFFKEWGRQIEVWTDLPAIPFFYGLIFKFIGESRLYIQIFTTILFSLTVVLTCLIGRDLWNDRIGLSGGLLLLGIPYLFTQVPLMLVDVPSMFFLTLSVFMFNRVLTRGGVLMAVLSATAIFLSLFSKYSLWLMLSVLVVLFLIRLRESPGVTLRRGVLVILLTGIFSGIVLLYKYDVISEQIRLLVSYQKPGLRRWTESFTSTFLFQVHPFVTLGALYSIYAAVKKRDLRYAVVVWLVVLVVFMQIKRIRYIVPVFPMLALMAAYGFGEIRTERLRKLVVLCAVFSSLVIAIFAYLPFLERISLTNLREAGRFLDSLDGRDVEVFTLPQKSTVNPAVSVPLLDLFTDKRILFDYELCASSPPADVERLPLRFTWHYRNPDYYRVSDRDSDTELAVVISGMPDDPLPAHIEKKIKDFHLLKTFGTPKRMFRFRTVVRVYGRAL